MIIIEIYIRESDMITQFSFYSTLGSAGVLPPGGDPGFCGTFGAACSVGAGGIGCSVGPTIGLSVPCSDLGYGFGCSGARLVLKVLANCSTAVVALVSILKIILIS